MNASIRIQGGSFYLDFDVYQACFGGRDAVAVMSREQELLLVALSPGAVGGSLVKIRNARGDRIIHAHELLRRFDLDGPSAIEIRAEWDPELAALRMKRPSAAVA